MIPEEILLRLRTHRREALTLLEQLVATAKSHAGSGLADALSHVARAHATLAEELEIAAEEARARADELAS
ncbi:MAG TPA: hypothetical protein VF789_32770 [Thermoanaerobaculia bacterium]